MSRTKGSTEEQALLKKLPQDGSKITNRALRDKLGWDEDKYWRIRNALLDSGLIKKTTGHGGAVIRVVENGEKKIGSKKKVKYKNEKSLYKDFRKTIETDFIRDERLQEGNFICEDISSQGRSRTGGTWTRPDIILITIRSYSYYPGKIMDIYSFEIKHTNKISIEGVFETASHSRFATKSYYCIHLPDGWEKFEENYPELSERIKNECQRFGIGLLLFKDADNYDTFDFIIDPQRKEPDPALIDNFINTQISNDGKQKISKMK